MAIINRKFIIAIYILKSILYKNLKIYINYDNIYTYFKNISVSKRVINLRKGG